jgi:hypothetical protein
MVDYDESMAWVVARFAIGGVALALAAACGSADPAREPALPGLTVSVVPVTTLKLQSGPILASANSLSRSRDGRIYIGDGSDRAVKVFAADGSQEPSVGAPGGGPGEFATLFSAGVLGDSVIGWDVRANRLTVFDAGGRYVRAISLQYPGSPRFSSVRVMDDSLLVASGWVQGAYDRPLVEVFDRTGRSVGKMAKMKRIFSPPNPQLLPHTQVYADGSEGVVFNTLHGFDTIQAYAPDGRVLGAGRVGLRGHHPVLNLRRLLRENHGSLHRPDSTWVQDAHYAALKLVALGGGLVAVQFGKLELTHGTDLLSTGGPVVVLRLEPGGVLRPVGQVEAPGALLGRSGPHEAMVLRWSGDELNRLELFRLTVAPSGAQSHAR